MEFILDSFLSPDSQADFYVWSAVLAAHFGLGVATYVLTMLVAARPTLALLLWLGWETAQMWLGSTLQDLMVDLSAEWAGVMVAYWLRVGSVKLALAPLVLMLAIWKWRRRA